MASPATVISIERTVRRIGGRPRNRTLSVGNLIPEVELRLEGKDELIAAFTAFVKRTGEQIYGTTEQYGRRLQADVQSNARALFDVVDYDASIKMRMTGGRIRPRANVTSDAPQAHRLEYGFIGVDSLGRHVEQSPRPHFRPALERIRADYVRAIAEALRR